MRMVLVQLLLLSSTWLQTALAQGPPLPEPDFGSPDQNIFYGATPPGRELAPVLVFLHGLRGTATDWWVDRIGTPNDMYEFAYNNGFRTAFLSLSPDNSRNDASIEDNAAVIKDALPKIVARFEVSQVYLVCHSKGGVDAQAAMLDPNISKLVKAVFNIATPNTGTELADWIFGPGQELGERLGLLTPAVEDLQTDNMAVFRAQADPILSQLDIPFYTMAGRTSRGHVITLITGPILTGLTAEGVKNDGLVPVNRTRLPLSYGIDAGEVGANHFANDSGSISFFKVRSHIRGLELTSRKFRRISSNGFVDFSPGGPEDASWNTWIWSMRWFKGKLYAGTGRAVLCASFATAATQLDFPAAYPPPIGDRDCPQDARDLKLAAEIWCWTPETKTWKRVFKSPETLPVEFDESGNPVKFTGRDTGFRGMAVFREPSGEEALCVTATTSAAIFEKIPYYEASGFPPPRILRSVDGKNFEAIPQASGTFLGDIAQGTGEEVVKARGFRSIAVYKNKLFVTASDFRGVGFIIVSENPKAGNDAWQRASPPADELPVWTLKIFNNFLYCTTGDRRDRVGYGVYKTDAAGDPPFEFTPIVTNGGFQVDALRSPDALSLEEFQDHLYVGSDRPTELIRIDREDNWELVVGHPRQTPDGYKAPISGIGQWFGNLFIGHFWRMQAFNNQLFLGTWDWSESFQIFPVADPITRREYGTDVFTTRDGVHWSVVTKSGFGNPFNYGTRSFEVTPFGMFLGTAKGEGGGEVFLNQSNLDFDGDGDIDQNDVDTVLAARNQLATGPEDQRDLDRDGKITILDVRKMVLMCSQPDCEVVTPELVKLPPPQNLKAASWFEVGHITELTWDPVPGAGSYRILRSELRPLLKFFPPEGIQLNLPFLDLMVNIPNDFLSGKFDELCEETDDLLGLEEGMAILSSAEFPNSILCFANEIFKAIEPTSSFLGVPMRFWPIATTTSTSYSGPLSFKLQSIYFVVAVDEEGRPSDPSNIVGAPSLALP